MFILKAIDIEGEVFDKAGPFSPAFVKAYDPDKHEGQGIVLFTNDIKEAAHFNDAKEVWNFIYQVPASKPIREDGKPNRPITCFTLEIYEMEIKHE